MAGPEQIKTTYGISYYPSQVSKIEQTCSCGNVWIKLKNGVALWTVAQAPENQAIIKANVRECQEDPNHTKLSGFKTGALKLHAYMYADKVEIENSNIEKIALDLDSANDYPFEPGEKHKRNLEGDQLVINNCTGDGEYDFNGVLLAEKIKISNSKDFDVAPTGVNYIPSLLLGNRLYKSEDELVKGTSLEIINSSDIKQLKGTTFEIISED